MKISNSYLFIVVVVFLAISCRKSEKRIERIIVGKWDEVPGLGNICSASLGPDTPFEFTADGKFIGYAANLGYYHAIPLVL